MNDAVPQDGTACLGKMENSVDQIVGVLIAIVVELYYVSPSVPQRLPRLALKADVWLQHKICRDGP